MNLYLKYKRKTQAKTNPPGTIAWNETAGVVSQETKTMFSRSPIVPLPKSLSVQQRLELINIYLENASQTKDVDIVLTLCHDAENALLQAKNATKRSSTYPKDNREKDLHEGVAAAYNTLGNLLSASGFHEVANTFYRKANKV
ncbi:hypothetical protein BGZ65_011016, partial [Modicella reniformis]